MGVVYWSPLCTIIGVINLIIFGLWHHYGQSIGFDQYAFFKNSPQWYQYVTSLFLHQEWHHLTSNAFYLFAFGCIVENKIKTTKFLIIYLISGIGGNLTFQFFGEGGAAIGASGAIFGVICSMVFTEPKAFVVTPGAPLPVPVIIFVIIHLISEFIMLKGDGASNISHVSHIGGGITGAIIAMFIISSRKSEPKPD